MNLENELNLHLVRVHRNKKRPMNQALGTTVDEYEAMLNDLQLQMQMLTSQAQQEVKNVETIKNEIEAQIKVQQDEIIKFLNNYSKEMVNKLMASVEISPSDLKFQGTAVYDLSFLRNFDYSKVGLINDRRIGMSRPKSLENLRLKLIEYKTEFMFAMGLVKNTNPYDPMSPILTTQRNIYLVEYYKAKAEYYNEVCIQGLLSNPTNDLSTLQDFISFNKDNIDQEKLNLESKKLSMSEEEYKARNEKITYIKRMVLMAELRKRYIEEALNSKWELPSFNDIRAYAGRFNITFSRAVFELKESTNYTMLYPSWFMKIAEMYNVIQRFDEGDVVQINPKDDRWLRKASELIDVDSGIEDAVLNFLDATVDYWALLSFGIEASENYYIEQVVDHANMSSPTIPQYPDMFIVPEFLINSAIEDESSEIGMGGVWDKIKRAAKSMYDTVRETVANIGRIIVKVIEKIGSVVAGIVKTVYDKTKKLATELAGEIRKGLENTLGRILPESIWSKIRNLTDVALDIVSLNISKDTLKKAVRGITDIMLFPLRVNEEMFKFLDKQGALKYLDKYSGGLFTSYRNLVNVPMQIQAGETINWKMVLIDALKVGATVFAIGGAVSLYQEIGKYGFQEYMKRNSTGISLIDGALTAGYMILSGQTTFSQAVTDGSKVMGTKTLINNTGLGNSSLGRTVASMGASATVTSIASNTAFNDEAKKLAEIEAKKFMASKAQKEVLEASGIKLPQKYADALSNSAYNYITNTSININDDGFYKDWMKVDINASSIINKVTKEAQNGFENAKEAITKLANYDYSKLAPEDRNYLDKMGIIAEDLKDGAKSAYNKAGEYVQKIADAKLKVDMDDVYKLSDKYSPKLFGYLWDKYGPRFDYDDLITPEDFLNYQIHVVTPGRRITKINWLSTNPANFALAGILGVAVVGLLAYNAE